MVFKKSTQPRRNPVPVMLREDELNCLKELEAATHKSRSEVVRDCVFLVYQKYFGKKPAFLVDKPSEVL